MSSQRLPRGERVHLRVLGVSDRTAYLRAVRASRRLLRPWSYPPEDSAGFADLVERPDGETFLICRNEDEAFAGMASLGQITFGNLRGAYLGYSAFVPYEGRGYRPRG